MSGIICCACSILTISVLQCALLQWRNDHSKIATYDESCCQDAVVRIVLGFSEPGEEILRKTRSIDSIAKEDRSGRLDKGTGLFEASGHHYHEQFMESFSSASYSKLDDDRAWSSQEWKTEATTYDRSGDLIKLLGEWYEKFDLVTRKFFSTEPRNP